MSEYVTQSAVQRARQVLVDRRHFVLDDDAWDRFIMALDQPERPNERIATLLARSSLLDE